MKDVTCFGSFLVGALVIIEKPDYGSTFLGRLTEKIVMVPIVGFLG